jgi:Transglycosylase SLT domain
MRLQAMAPSGATVRVDRFAWDAGRECLMQRSGSGPERAVFVPVVGRSLVVCTALAAGFATAVITMAGRMDGVTPAYAAMALSVPMPKPRIRVAAAPTENLDDDPRLATAEETHSRIDRVPYDFWLPSIIAPRPAPPKVGDPNDILTFGPMRIRRHLVDKIIRAAKVTEADPVLLMAIADKESAFSAEVQARTSSATGLFQFIERTWLEVVREFGVRHGLAREAKAIVRTDDDFVVADAEQRTRILELRRDPYLSALLAAEMLKRDRARIARRIGRPVTDGETYLAHFLGPDDAERFMEKVVRQPQLAAAQLLPRPARANRPIFFARAGRKAKSLSVAEVHGKFEKMISLRLDRYRDVHEVAGTAVAEATMR